MPSSMRACIHEVKASTTSSQPSSAATSKLTSVHAVLRVAVLATSTSAGIPERLRACLSRHWGGVQSGSCCCSPEGAKPALPKRPIIGALREHCSPAMGTVIKRR